MATTTGFVQRMTLIQGARTACVWVGSTPTSVELFWVQMTSSDDAAAIEAKRSTINVLCEAQIAGRRVDVVHGSGSAEIDSVWTTACDVSDTPLQVDAIEVTQGIQDLAQSIPLFAGKRTVVRVYLSDYSGAGVTVRGEISVRQGPTDVPFVIPSENTVVVDPAQAGDIPAKRDDETRSLNFVLPSTAEGPLSIQIENVIEAVTDGPVSLVPFGCERRPAVWFHATAPMRVRVLGMRYTDGGTSYVPTPLDFALLLSWLGRAYPTGQVVSTTGVVDATAPVEFGCGDINAQLAAIRALDMAAGGDERTHYYGLVSDGGFFMRGCTAGIPSSPDPATVASGPTGAGTWGWDTDGSYGDWYGGHELGHTYGRRHPGFCGETQSDLDNYPFVNGQLANSNASFAGFDVGDPANDIPMAALPGTQWHDVMTYCNFQWLCAYTYLGIRRRLAGEDALGAGGGAGPAPGPGGPGRGGPGTGGRPDQRFPHHAPPQRPQEPEGVEVPGAPAGEEIPVSVVAHVNLTRREGKIAYVNPLERPVASRGEAAGPARLRVKAADGTVLREVTVPVRLNSELMPSDDRVGIVDAVLQVDASARAIELVLDEQTVDTYTIGGPMPGARALRTVDRGAADVGIVADTEEAVEGGQSYSIQVSTDDGRTWQTMGVGLKTPSVDLDRRQFRPGQEVRVRVVATNGLRRSVAMSERFKV